MNRLFQGESYGRAQAYKESDMTHRTWLYLILAMTVLVGGCNLSTNDKDDATPVPPSATPAPTPTPSADLLIYLVAPEGSTGPGEPIACGSYMVPVVRGPAPTTDTPRQITSALTELFSIREDFLGESGLYNPLHLSDLSVQRVTVDAGGQATIELSGSLMLLGVCADPLIVAQIEQTARQFDISGVSILVNDTPIADLISGRGTD